MPKGGGGVGGLHKMGKIFGSGSVKMGNLGGEWRREGATRGRGPSASAFQREARPAGDAVVDELDDVPWSCVSRSWVQLYERKGLGIMLASPRRRKGTKKDV